MYVVLFINLGSGGGSGAPCSKRGGGGSQQEQTRVFNNLFRNTSDGDRMCFTHIAGVKIEDGDLLTVNASMPLNLAKFIDAEVICRS